MTLTAKDVEEITRLLEESSFDELYLELDGLKLSLRRGAGAAAPAPGAVGVSAAQVPGVPAQLAAAKRSAIRAPAASAAAVPTTSSSSSSPVRAPRAAGGPASHDVPAPLLGTFYRAPKPGAPPFVEVGSLVEEETIIAIIEVMKLMNTVRAGMRGRVTEIVARDGDLVEYGETLLRVGVQS
ncbi:MAG: acetyl-CoA carboxylase biotin carboxyl carrier protein [Steroidobacteraceae bacterium]